MDQNLTASDVSRICQPQKFFKFPKNIKYRINILESNSK